VQSRPRAKISWQVDDELVQRANTAELVLDRKVRD
jgi:hypothetical protein